MAREIVRIGMGLARVVDVTPEQVEYLDAVGQQRSIDLGQCAMNWVQWTRQHWTSSGAPGETVSEWNSHCVGQRDSSAKPPWLEFRNERRTRFEFSSGHEVLALLARPLRKAGWNTFDLS